MRVGLQEAQLLLMVDCQFGSGRCVFVINENAGASMTQHIFSEEDQINFAKLSGDYNPLHLDPILSRRLIFGRPAVHGIHAVLWALDLWLREKKSPIELCTIKADFVAPIAVCEPARCEILKDENEEVKLRITVNGAKAAVIKATFVSMGIENQIDNLIVLPSCPEKEEPYEHSTSAISFMAGNVKLHLDISAVKHFFPNLIRCLSSVQVAELLATTRIVGMKCPGKNSVFSDMSLKFFNRLSDIAEMRYQSSEFDERFSRITVNISGPDVIGNLSVFYRPPPKKQPSYLEVVQYVSKTEFAGQQALIIGGSRGLGEVTAKLLSAGGAKVRLTYHCGEQDARNIVREITEAGGIADAIKFDVLSPPMTAGASLFGKEWTHAYLYYFATPFIFEGARGKFSSALFDKFCNYYVKGFINTIQIFKHIGINLDKVFYPSSVAIEEMPLDMGEYSAAKAAGEVVCQFLNKTEKKSEIIFTRLPRLDTDQTASIMHVQNNDPVVSMLEIVRQMQNN